MKSVKSIIEAHPELIQVWEAAWQKQPSPEDPVIINCESERDAMNLRQQLYQVRKTMLKEKYTGAVNFNKLELGVRNTKDLHIYLPSWLAAVRETLQKEGVPPPPPVLPVDEAPLENPMIGEEPSKMSETINKLFQTGSKPV